MKENPRKNQESAEEVGKGGLKEVTEQIYYRGRRVYERGFKRDRREELSPNDMLGEEEIVISKTLYDVYDLDENASGDEVLRKVEESFSDDKFFEKFVTDIARRNNLGDDARERMLNDEKLKTVYLEYLGAKADEFESPEELDVMMSKLNRMISVYISLSEENVGEVLLESRRNRWFVGVNRSLLKNKKVGNVFAGSQREIYMRWKRGRISKSEYHEEITKLYSESIQNSGDDELKEMWRKEQEEDVFVQYFKEKFKREIGPNSEEAVAEEDVKEVNAQVVRSPGKGGFKIIFNDSGIAGVDTDHCSLEIRAYRDKKRGDVVYYVEDDYSNGGIYGPVRSPLDLQEVIDARQIDAYMTELIDDPQKQSEFSGIPDDDVVGLAVKVIGSADSARSFKLRKRDRGLLSKLVEFIVDVDLGDSLSVDKKIKLLSRKLSENKNVDEFRKLLLAGDWEEVHEFALS